jgi:hypothetical protein
LVRLSAKQSVKVIGPGVEVIRGWRRSGGSSLLADHEGSLVVFGEGEAGSGVDDELIGVAGPARQVGINEDGGRGLRDHRIGGSPDSGGEGDGRFGVRDRR